MLDTITTVLRAILLLVALPSTAIAGTWTAHLTDSSPCLIELTGRIIIVLLLWGFTALCYLGVYALRSR